tara:strand:+ start:2570 stop:3103 length:534 start_codon:yes stop_codon:yes gene_type:complete
MSVFIYFCSKQVFNQFNTIKEQENISGHGTTSDKNLTAFYPLENTEKIINPKNLYQLKNKFGFTSLIMVDHIEDKKGIVHVSDHINRTGKSFLRGKTPFKDFPTFPDISNIYIKKNGKTLMSVGEKNTLNINTQENVILSSWIAPISSVWSYVNVQIVGIGVGEEVRSLELLTSFIK